MNVDPRQHWHTLTREQQADAIRRMHAEGMSDTTIAAATQLTVEFINRVIGQQRTHARGAHAR